MPQAGPDKPWYSFDFGPIHFLQYSTEHVFAPGGCGQGVYRECVLSPEQIVECIAAWYAFSFGPVELVPSTFCSTARSKSLHGGGSLLSRAHHDTRSMMA